jgi:hypothetical protein
MRTICSKPKGLAMAIGLTLSLALDGALLGATPAAADPVSWIAVGTPTCTANGCSFPVSWGGDTHSFLLIPSRTITSKGIVDGSGTSCSQGQDQQVACISNPGAGSMTIGMGFGCGVYSLTAFVSEDNVETKTATITCPPPTPPPLPTPRPSCDEQSQLTNRDGTCRCRYAGWTLQGSKQPGEGWCVCQQSRLGGPVRRCEVPQCPPGLTWQWISGGGGGCGCPGRTSVPIGPDGPYCPPPPSWQTGRPVPGPASRPMPPQRYRARVPTPAVRKCPAGSRGTPPHCTAIIHRQLRQFRLLRLAPPSSARASVPHG